MIRLLWRRERDSNPCEIALKRFSRPPRYDHFDIPPYKRNYEIVLEKTLEEKTLLSEKCVCFPQIRGFFAGCVRCGKEVSRPPRYDRFDTSPYMKLSFDRNHQIFNCFRNSFRNVLLCCCRSAEKVRCCKAFQGFCVCSNRKFSNPFRYFSCGAFVIAKNPSTDIRSCMAGSFLHKVRRLALTSGILTHRCAFVKVYFIINAACRSLFFINFKNTLAFSENMW